MNRLGAALTGEASSPYSGAYVFNANPVTSSPNSEQIVAGMMRDDLFTVVHELYLSSRPVTPTSCCLQRFAT